MQLVKIPVFVRSETEDRLGIGPIGLRTGQIIEGQQNRTSQKRGLPPLTEEFPDQRGQAPLPDLF